MAPRLAILRPGTLDYASAYELQQHVADALRLGGDPALILVEHPPTYTIGARGSAANFLAGQERLREAGAAVVYTDRGGDVTFHGPGQMVGYPILNLHQLKLGASEYVCQLEQILIDVLAQFAIQGSRSSRSRGVWVGEAKIAAIGVRISRGITTHGFALNVNTDLSWFDHIVPCGLPGVRITSMQEIAGEAPDMRLVQAGIIEAFSRHLGMTVAQEVAEVAE